MPELPEVETVCQGIKPHLISQVIQSVIIRETRLRWPVASTLIKKNLQAQKILNVTRRAKYIYIQIASGYLIIHLGMSGTLRVCTAATAIKKHDHFDCTLSNGKILRFNDPRRFGSIQWAKDPTVLPLIAHLGPEPLEATFSTEYLYSKAQSRKVPIKAFIMNNQVVVGVGNIYASESLFLAKIHPLMPANQLSKAMAKKLHGAITQTLHNAIVKGGTTLKDFCQSDGTPGYFSTNLNVYGKKGNLCTKCKQPIQSIVIAQRMTYFCVKCQKLPSFTS